MPTGRITASIPFFQKSIDSKQIKHGLNSRLKGTENTKRSKVSETRGNVSIKLPGTKHKLNLTGIQHGAAKKTASQFGSQQTVQKTTATIGKPDFGPTGTDAPKPKLTPDQTFTAIGNRIGALEKDVAELHYLQQSARKEDVRSGKAASREFELIDKQAVAQKEVEFLLGEVDKLVKENPGSPSAGDLEKARKGLIALSIEVEFPQSVEVAHQEISSGLKEASQKGGVLRTALGHYDSVMLNRLLDPSHPAGIPDDPGATRAKLLKDIDRALRDISPFGELAPGQDGRIQTSLEEARAALQLQDAFHQTIDNIDRLRQRCMSEPDLSDAKFPVGRLLKEFGHFAPDMHGNLNSPSTLKQAHGMGVIASLSGLFADSQVPHVFQTDDPTVGKLMVALKADHCQTLAVAKFLTDTDHPAFESQIALATERKGSPLTNAEIGKVVRIAAPELQGKFDDAMKKGKEASTARDLYFRQLGRVERIVGSGGAGKYDGITAYKASTWLRNGLPDGMNKSEQTQLAEDRLKKLGKSNPEAAFMVAGLAFLEHTVATFDRDVLGLPYHDNVQLDHFDIDRVLKLAGLTDSQMQKLGYDGSQARQTHYNELRTDALLTDDPVKTLNVSLEADNRALGERLFNLSKGGFSNVSQLQRHQNLFYAAANETLTNRSIQEMIGSAASQSPVAVARHMAMDKMSEAIGLFTGVDVNASTKQTAKTTDSDVMEGFGLVSSAVKRNIGADPEAIDNLQEGSQAFQMLDDKLDELMTARGKVDSNIADARKILKEASKSKDGPKLDVNPDKPAGLRTAKAIIKALDLQTEIDGYKLGKVPLTGDQINAKVAERDAILNTLKGLDTEMVRRPWYQKLSASLGGREAPDIESLRELRQAATCIVYIRETSVTEKANLDDSIAAVALTRQDILNQRLEDHPEALGTIKQVIRTAVLAHWPADNKSLMVQGGNIQQAYEPSMHREAIERTLKSWGIEPSEFGPEISDAINSSLTAKDVNTWASESTKIDRETLLLAERPTRMTRFTEALRTELKEMFSKQGAQNAGLFLVNKKIVDEQVKQELSALQLSLKDGDKIDFKSGYKLSVNTGKIPLDPTGTFGIRGRLAASALSNLVMERGSDGYKVTGRFGGQLGVGVDLIADQTVSPSDSFVTAKAGGSVGGDLQGGVLAGFTETFPDTTEGRDACNRFIMALANGEKPNVSIFEKVSDAATNREVSGKISGNAKGYIKAEITKQPFGNDGDPFASHADDPKFKSGAKNQLGVGANAGIEIAASIGGKYNVAQSFNKITISTEHEESIGWNASLNIYAKVMTGTSTAISAISHATSMQDKADENFEKMKDGKPTGEHMYDAGGDATAPENLFLAEMGSALVSVTKTKLEYTRSDMPDVPDRLTKGEIVRRSNLNYGSDRALIGAGNKQLAQLLKTDETLKKDLEALKKQVGGEDFLQVTYSLSAANLEKVADMLKIADDIADSRPWEAASIRGKVASFMKNEDNYEPTKITLLKKTVSKDAVNRGNALLLKFDIIGESTVESSEVVIKMTPKTKASPELTI